jgi:TATA-box binding protein (TBP) (component of TFIID and TFIIIB)
MASISEINLDNFDPNRCAFIESGILKIFNEKLLENPYLHEIAHYFNIPDGDIYNNLPTPSLDISSLSVSTTVVLCHLGCKIDLDILYKNLDSYTNLEKGYSIESVYYRSNPTKGNVKPKKKKQSVVKSNTKKRDSFYNQVTVVFNYYKDHNIKIFRNGRVHITGAINHDHGKKCVEFMIGEIKRIYDLDKNIVDHSDDLELMGVHDWCTVLINSDFNCNFKIRREKLYEILDNEYGLVVNYESDCYPGVKISFFWNEKDTGIYDPRVGKNIKTGICRCKKGSTCNGKGLGSLDVKDKCRKITISVFQSGKIIITGARDYLQIDECYEYVISVLYKYYHQIARIS